MNRDAKNISSNHRPEIEKIKGYIRATTNSFDGVGYPFKQAIKELRNEGYTIKLNRTTWMYEKVNQS
ncbi:MAG: hypothetical protein AAF391_10410 [Bacteroidota bacterium]